MNTGRLIAKIVAIQIALIPGLSFADENTETNITTGRASILLDRASEGLQKILNASKPDMSDEWANELQNKASDLCAFIKYSSKCFLAINQITFPPPPSFSRSAFRLPILPPRSNTIR